MTHSGFFADSMLGKLARWLRLMGFSVEYAKSDKSDNEIIEHCKERGLFLLTRDKELAIRYQPSIYMPSDNYREQLKLFLGEFEATEELYFTRCPLCNGEIRKVPVREFDGEIPEGVRKRFEVIHLCTSCGKVYWEGSHFDVILKTIRELNSGRKP